MLSVGNAPLSSDDMEFRVGVSMNREFDRTRQRIPVRCVFVSFAGK